MVVVAARHIGTAHRGLGQFLVQRGTAVFLALFILFITARWALYPPVGYAEWVAWMSPPYVRLAAALAIAALLAHAWIGLRSIYLDYLHSLAVRATVSALTAAGLVSMGVWAGDILLWGFRP